MFEILGQGSGEIVAVGGSCAIAGSIVTLLIKRGFSLRVGGNGGNGQKTSLCPIHEEFSKRQDERYQTIITRLDDIHEGQKRLHERFDEFVKQ